MVLFLQTPHLDLVAATLLHAEAELGGPRQVARLLGVTVPKDWPPPGISRQFIEGFRSRMRADGPAAIGWYAWYAVCRGAALQPSALVGAAAFFGQPDPQGVVELGFTILPEYRGRRHGVEMVSTLAGHALADQRVRRVVSDARARDRATLAVLRHCGFHPEGELEPGIVRMIRCLGDPDATDDGGDDEQEDDS